MSTNPSEIKRGQIWSVDLNPTIGSEINKKRPVVVISSDAVGKLPIKLIAPITGWNPYFENNVWHVKIIPDDNNGLSKTSAVDALQLRGLDTRRFISKIGFLSQDTMDEINYAIAAVIEYQ